MKTVVTNNYFLLICFLLVFAIYAYNDPWNPNITMYYDEPFETDANGTIIRDEDDNDDDKEGERK